MYTDRFDDNSAGINSSIVRTLQNYNSEIPIDFLAKKVGRRRSEVLVYLIALNEKGVVQLSDKNVALCG